MYSEYDKKQKNKIRKYYPELLDFYKPMMGVFIFDSNQFHKNINTINKWINDFKDFYVKYEDDKYYLTNF